MIWSVMEGKRALNKVASKLTAATFGLGIATILAVGATTGITASKAYAADALPQVANAKVAWTNTSKAKVTWSKAALAKVKGYQVKVYTGGKYVKGYTVKGNGSTSQTITGLHANRSYTATVRTYGSVKSGKSYKTVYGRTSNSYFKTAKMTPQMLANWALSEYESGAKAGTYHYNGMKYKNALGYKPSTTWCSVFVSYGCTQLGHPELNSNWVKHFSGKFADRYTNLMTRHKNKGYTPQVGDLSIWRPKGEAWDVLGGTRSHIGIVYKVDTKKKIVYTVEGNAKKFRGSSTKNRVFKRSYHYGNKDSYCPDLFITVADK